MEEPPTITQRRANEGIGFGARAARLLRLIPRIYLHQQIGPAAFLGHGIGNGLGQLGPIQRFDHIRDPHGIPRLIALQAADDMKLKPRMAGAQPRKFLRRFLDPVFAKHHLPSGEGCFHRFHRVGLGNGHQGHGICRTIGAGAGFGDSRPNAGEVVGNGKGIGHGKAKWQGIGPASRGAPRLGPIRPPSARRPAPALAV